ncbi:MAG: hypothetical protein A2606_01150 [Candidatus Yanofskybacteria bacterium RIFOXYD1_FULL_42_10]|uniref:Transcription elongation factor GreA/GreB C-terminal domain-containing protein n=2 Tax=Candidatus Yanofskyibacteriota TaxID=1752733 RepID=A0A1F8HX42_9BACT|nr:MAG: hypothetical protein UU84_C0023G0007 [Candidatus Yanofskybacteria bacterium GW2011_GWC2_41_9]OGN09901.1 MAG: hypothetical protein A3C64_00870 [Candidatus Yanofskybacteria bacterium RIFCSPHIGHO2_02_FULL_41_12]OGN41600.1 MAG: hypothetical protein A2606_01150 [Candidatus Yanofskybacteria bacterium RIFOXYD1_FULL_42_10]
MDKQKIIDLLLTKLREVRTATIKSYEGYKKASAEAPGAMQSHSDTSKFQIGILADSAMQRVQNIDQLIAVLRQIKTSQNSENKSIQVGTLVQTEENGKMIYFFITPEGAGGQKFESDDIRIQTISINSLMGKAMFSKKAGQEVEIQVPAGIKRFKILSIQ